MEKFKNGSAVFYSVIIFFVSLSLFFFFFFLRFKSFKFPSLPTVSQALIHPSMPQSNIFTELFFFPPSIGMGLLIELHGNKICEYVHIERDRSVRKRGRREGGREKGGSTQTCTLETRRSKQSCVPGLGSVIDGIVEIYIVRYSAFLSTDLVPNMDIIHMLLRTDMICSNSSSSTSPLYT